MLGYSGRYLYSIDNKGRINLPSRFRKMTEGKIFVISKGLEECLFVFPEARWAQYLKGFMPMTFAKKADRDFFRLLFSNTEYVKLDDQGRLKINDDLRDYAKLKREALILGVMDHIEMWNPEYWESYHKGIAKSYPQLAEEALGQIDLSKYIE
ncbi:MAG: division/cell wall cluster transcriptional repressor MraZ [Candidatus Glassbacteria bacterium]